QRQTVGVTIGRIEIEVVLAIALAGAVYADGEHAAIIVRDRLLPLPTPARGSMWHRLRLDRRGSGACTPDIGAPDDERIDLAILEEHLHPAAGLVGIVAAHDTAAGLRIVRRADAGQQQQSR